MINLDIPGTTYFEDLIFLSLASNLLKPKSKLVDVGSFIGRSTFTMASIDQSFTVYAIDVWDESLLDIFDNDQEKKVLCSKQEFLRQMYLNGISNVVPIQEKCPMKKWEHGKVDLVFIDANYGYNTIYDNILFWSKNVKSKHMICGTNYDNTMFPNVKKAVDDAAKKVDSQFSVHPASKSGFWTFRIL